MTGRARTWAPAVVLGLGAVVATLGIQTQRAMPLRGELATALPGVIAGDSSRDFDLSDDERIAAGVTDYLVRIYRRPNTDTLTASLFVGYFDKQTQGRTIHSPRNCLPGSGWEPLQSSSVAVSVDGGSVTVNRYLLQRGSQRALVLYWYQGRGRVASNEYLVKWDLLRDAALRRRSEEALVRIVVPVVSTEEAALTRARSIAGVVVPALATALPT